MPPPTTRTAPIGGAAEASVAGSEIVAELSDKSTPKGVGASKETSNLLEEALTRPDHPPEADDQGVPEVMARLEKLRRVCRWSEQPVGSPHSLCCPRL